MIYTVRFSHLKDRPHYTVGDTITRGDVVGIMGNTGQSTGAHLHIDVVRHKQSKPWLLDDVDPSCRNNGKHWPDPVQLNHFIDAELFGGLDFDITTYYLDPAYKKRFGKRHPAYDVVVRSKALKNQIYWNRSMSGIVSDVGFNSGYGNYILISYEA